MKIISCVLILFFSCSLAFAHSCKAVNKLPDNEYKQKLDEVDNIFQGEIVSIKDLGYQSFLIKFKVLKVWKGEAIKEITIHYADPCSSLNPVLEKLIGEKWIVYGYREKRVEPYLFVGCCPVLDNDRLKLFYGEGATIEHQAQEIEQPSQQNTTNEGFWSWLWKKITSLFS